jgi:transposase
MFFIACSSLIPSTHPIKQPAEPLEHVNQCKNVVVVDLHNDGFGDVKRDCSETTRSGYSKTLEYEYRVKTAVLGTLKRYSIISLTLYLEWYIAYSIVYSGGPH